MADEKEDPAETGEAPPPNRKRKLLIGGVAILLLLAAGLGGWFVFGAKDEAKHGDKKPAAEHEEVQSDSVARLIDVPPMVVNLRVPGGEPRFLKLRFMLLARSVDRVEPIKNRLPELIDAFQPFLRELRPDDLAGAAAVLRVKEELRLRAGDVLGETAVEDILIQDMIQQ